MAQEEKSAKSAKELAQGSNSWGVCTFSELRNRIREDKSSKWKAVKAFLWWIWLSRGYFWCREVVPFLEGLGNLLLLIGFGLVIFVLNVLMVPVVMIIGLWDVVEVLTMGIWYPIVIAFSPKKAVNLIWERALMSEDEELFIPLKVFYPVHNFCYCTVAKNLWGWMPRFFPMDKRKYFLVCREEQANIKKLPVPTQVSFVLAWENASDRLYALNKISSEAVKELWDKYPEIREEIAKMRGLTKEWITSLLQGDEEDFVLLCNLFVDWIKQGEAILSKNLHQLMAMLSESGKEAERALTILKGCAEAKKGLNIRSEIRFGEEFKTMGNFLAEFITELGNEGEVSGKILDIMKAYWKNNTYPESFVLNLIDQATATEGKSEKAFELLLDIARRDGLSDKSKAEFFAKCEKTQEEEMGNVFDERVSLSFLKKDDATWRKFCERAAKSVDNEEKLDSAICEKVQLAMSWKQYRIYKECGLQLTENVSRELLMTEITSDNRDYFKEVYSDYCPGYFSVLSGVEELALLDTPWKSEIIFEVRQKEEDAQKRLMPRKQLRTKNT